MKALLTSVAVAASSFNVAQALTLDVNSPESISNASATLAYGLMLWYPNNQTSTPPVAVGVFPGPLYWWEAGAIWGALIDYWAYTNDTSYVPTVTQALLAQVGPDNNYMPPAYFASLGNDDQAFWAFAVLTAVEYGFPTPSGNSSTVWLDLAEAVFNTQAARWDTTTCGGGLRWQIFSSNEGYTYKNTISNGGFFQIAARLAHYTGNQTYADWAEKAWDWMRAIDLIDDQYNVFDGSADTLNCTQVDHTPWSYNPSVLVYGAAMMYNYTNGSEVWQNRTTGILEGLARTYFSPFPNATDIMFQPSCEPMNTCDDDQLSFKAYASRWMSKAAIVAPYIAQSVSSLLTTSARAAAQACSGGVNGTTCGEKWYVGGYDGSFGVGQELSALETIQALLLLHGPVNATQRYPQTAQDVHIEVFRPTTTLAISPRTSSGGSGDGDATATAPPRSADAGAGSRTSVAGGRGVWILVVLPLVVALLFGSALVS